MFGDRDGAPGRRTYRPVRRRPPIPGDMPDEVTAGLIRGAIGRYPKATAEELRSFVCLIDGGPEFDVRAIRAVMYSGE